MLTIGIMQHRKIEIDLFFHHANGKRRSMEECRVHLVHLLPHKMWFQSIRALRCLARIHPLLDTLVNCHRQHLASGALPQLEHLSVAALVMDNME